MDPELLHFTVSFLMFLPFHGLVNLLLLWSCQRMNGGWSMQQHACSLLGVSSPAFTSQIRSPMQGALGTGMSVEPLWHGPGKEEGGGVWGWVAVMSFSLPHT